MIPTAETHVYISCGMVCIPMYISARDSCVWTPMKMYIHMNEPHLRSQRAVCAKRIMLSLFFLYARSAQTDVGTLCQRRAGRRRGAARRARGASTPLTNAVRSIGMEAQAAALRRHTRATAPPPPSPIARPFPRLLAPTPSRRSLARPHPPRRSHPLPPPCPRRRQG